MRCPECNYICGEIRDSDGINYHCINPECDWPGEYVKKEDD